ncbi:preprotein translocase subunit YajC [Bacillus pakistanensis]|uniref:Preprotein translocase subunit YajC n=1 Tax=Rossellomorea pakistanensis TaxID=992288 RepID=A0ABS2NBN0_9BACI|nr:hypothetical protein [Bacillus pakistanensis]MBM7585269.1 preprotein translocase subunit YajC [Bacillus pakistanensis]
MIMTMFIIGYFTLLGSLYYFIFLKPTSKYKEEHQTLTNTDNKHTAIIKEANQNA